jgi:hypothetical protein
MILMTLDTSYEWKHMGLKDVGELPMVVSGLDVMSLSLSLFVALSIEL